MKNLLVIIALTLSLFGTSLAANQQEIDELAEATPDLSIKPTGELYQIFRSGSKYTSIQRKKKLSDLTNKVVIWTLTVYQITEARGGRFKIQCHQTINLADSIGFTASGQPVLKENPNQPVDAMVYLTPRTKEESDALYTLKKGNKVRIKGRLTGKTTFNSLIIDPAILWKGKK